MAPARLQPEFAALATREDLHAAAAVELPAAKPGPGLNRTAPALQLAMDTGGWRAERAAACSNTPAPAAVAAALVAARSPPQLAYMRTCTGLAPLDVRPLGAPAPYAL